MRGRVVALCVGVAAAVAGYALLWGGDRLNARSPDPA